MFYVKSCLTCRCTWSMNLFKFGSKYWCRAFKLCYQICVFITIFTFLHGQFFQPCFDLIINFSNLSILANFSVNIFRPELLLDSLVPPIPRSVYENIINYPDINQLIEVLKERKQIRDGFNSGNAPRYEVHIEMSPNLKSVSNCLQCVRIKYY